MTAANKNLEVFYHCVDKLVPYKNNPRTHTEKQIHQIAKSISQFGFTNPILLDDNFGVIAGHGRLEAAKRLGMNAIPTIRLSNMTEAQKKAYIIADNKLAENAGWDQKLLALEIKYISEIDVDFDLSVIGFETPEIDILLHEEPSESELEIVPPERPVTRPGDKWILGPHIVLCADATRSESFEALLGVERPEIVFIDPPYNVKIDGHVRGKGHKKHDEFLMASGEMSQNEFTSFLQSVFKHLAHYTVDGSLHYVCMDWRHLEEIVVAGHAYTELKNLCVWNKTNGGMGSFYRSKHELVFVFKHGTAKHINNIDLGKFGRYRTNVWDYAGVNTFKNDRENELNMHPTVKPLQLVADVLLDASHRNSLVLDCFGGSGSTLIAAEQHGRRARLVEYDPRYVDVIITRYETLTGKHAVLAETKEVFKQVSAQRLMQSANA